MAVASSAATAWAGRGAAFTYDAAAAAAAMDAAATIVDEADEDDEEEEEEDEEEVPPTERGASVAYVAAEEAP